MIDEDDSWPEDGTRADYFLRTVVVILCVSMPVGLIVMVIAPAYAIGFEVVWATVTAAIVIRGAVRWVNRRDESRSQKRPPDAP